MGRHALGTAFGLDGAANDLVAALAPGAVEADVLARLDRLLAPYGGRGAYGREDQISHRFLSDEIQETRVTSVLIPSIFLGVTAFLIHLVLGRLVGMQRDQIAVLKAFGYSSRAVAGHYVALALAPVAAGCTLGAAVGLWFAAEIATVYADFFQFPEVGFQPQASVILAGMAIGLGSGFAGALGAALRVLALPPAEAMRPEAPTRFRPSAFERGPLGRRLTAPGRILVRHLHRRPVRALLSIAGLASAGAILVVSPFFFDAVDRLKVVQFEHVQREAVTVAFREVRDPAALDELRRLPGVQRVEPYRVVDARLSPARRGDRSERVALTGLSPDAELRRIVDQRLRVHLPPPTGVLLSALLAEKLGVGPGDRLDIEVLEGRQPRFELQVVGTTDDLLGAAVYLDLGFLRRKLGEGDVASGAFLSVDPAELDALYARLKRLPAVAGVGVREAARAGFEKTIAESFRISLSITVLFACVLAAGMVYNGARVALSERGRELASLRVLGFSRGEVATLLLGEQAILTLVSIPVGLLGGYGLCWLIVLRVQSELFRIPLVVTASTPVFATATVLGAAVASGLFVYRRLCHLDLVAVLKTRE
jgi:putative ABC transport system permease protein